MKFATGFTLTELIVIIIVLGILSALALPKFINVGTDARIAKITSLAGAMRSAASLANAKAIVENKTDCSIDPTIVMGGDTITLRCGYPCPHPNGIAKAVVVDNSFTWIGGNCAGVGGNINVRISDAPNPATCNIRYNASSGVNPPNLIVTTTGC